MIGIEECESDGEIVTQLDRHWGMKRESPLVCMSTRAFALAVVEHTNKSLLSVKLSFPSLRNGASFK